MHQLSLSNSQLTQSLSEIDLVILIGTSAEANSKRVDEVDEWKTLPSMIPVEFSFILSLKAPERFEFMEQGYDTTSNFSVYIFEILQLHSLLFHSPLLLLCYGA